MNVNLIIGIWLVAVCIACGENTSNPEAHFKANLDAGDQFKQIDYDINGDGVDDKLFVMAESFDESNEIEQPSTWDVYLSKAGEEYVVQGKQIYEGGPGGLEVLPGLCFVGVIKELEDKKGLVSIRVDNPREGDPIAYIYAYTFEADGTVVEHELAKYPAEDSNAIYDKYLDTSKRTALTVQDKQK